MGRALGMVGVCILLSGLLVNAYLAVVARNLSPAQYGHFGAFWSIALVVGFGAFLPVEQELARLGPGRVLGAAARVALGLAGVEMILVLAASPFLLDSMGGSPGSVAAVAVLCLVSAGQFVVRGALVGQQRMALYGGLLVLDTALRVVFALAVGWAFVTDSAGFAWTLVAAIAVAHLPVLVSLARRTRTEDSVRVPVRDFARAVIPLLVGSLCAQLLLNGVPVLVAAVATEAERDTAGLFLAAFLLARVPLFVAVPLQTTLLPTLTGLFESGRRVLVRALVRLAGGLLLVGLAGVAVALTFGPWLVRLVFGPEYDIAGTDLMLITLGVTAHLGLIIITQALVAGALHSAVAWSWSAGIAAAGVTFAVVPDLLLRAELAFLLGSGLGWIVGVALLFIAGNDRSKRRVRWSRRPGHRPDLLRAVRVRAD